MSRTNTEIRFLARLDELIASNSMIMDFLQHEDLMSKEERRAVTGASDPAKALQLHIAKMKGNKLQLLEYEWSILPEERLKLTIITDRDTKEFSYNY